MTSIQAVMRLRDQGLTQQAIAAELGCSRSWVSAILIRCGRASKSGAARKQATQDRRARVAAMHAAGQDREAIAAELGVTARTIYDDLHAVGVTRTLSGCGTWGGCQVHQKRGEKPCNPCRLARNDYVAAWRRQSGTHPSRRTRRLRVAAVPATATIRGATAVAAARAIQRHVPVGDRAELLLMLGLVEPAEPATAAAS